MKISYPNFFSPLFFLAIFFCSFQNVSAQEEKYRQGNLEITKQNINELDTPELRAKMKADGLSDPVIDKLIAQRKLWIQQGRNVTWTNVQRNNQTPIVNATCSDMGVENGWGSWTWQNGSNSGGNPPTWGGAPAANPASSPAGPGGAYYSITTGAGVDPNTPSAGNPSIPLVCPGFGNNSIKLGDGCGVNSHCNQLTYPLTVTAADTNFIYSYAIVLEDPNGGHTAAQTPFVEFAIYDSNGNVIPCSFQHYTGGPNIPGFYYVNGNGCAVGGLDQYKPWTLVGINLSAYVNQTLNVVITNADCTLGGHFAYSYWDFSCGALSTNPASYCLGQQVSITAPVDPSIAYTYQWSQNGNPYTGPPSATAQTVTPFPQPGDTFSVEVIQPSGCNFYITYVPQPMSITPNFSSVTNCGTVTFTDLSTTPNGNPIVTWNWTFPSGNPATSTAQNPTATFPAGNYTVTLIVSSQSGCTDTIALPVSVTGLPVAAFSATTVCSGNPTQFTNSSVSAAGDPITGWSWSFPGGNPAASTSQNPTVTYPPGNYTASLTVTSQSGCTSSVTQSITVNPLPVPDFKSTIVCFNNATVFTDQSTGPAVQWNWDFGDGNVSALQSPSHTYANPGSYTVTLVATNSFGCIDSIKKNIIVNPVPVANFTSVPVCFGSSTCFTDASTITYGNVTGWSWNFNDPNSGLNNISNLQNPCHVFTGLGPYNVLLTITSDSGCQSNATLPALINPPPVAAFTNSSVCLNSPSSFTNTSSPANANDPITNWNWNFGDGSPASNLTNPSHNYTTAGNYTVTLIITSQLGCKDTVDNPVIVYSNPIADFAHPDSGCAPVCEKPITDLSQGVSGNIATWEWSCPGGSPSSSTSPTPNVCWNTPGIYDVQLIVTTQYGCKDTMLIPKCIHVFAWPTADFCVNPTQTSVHKPEFTFCNLWSPDVVNWSWNFGDNSSLDSTHMTPAHSYSATTVNNDYYSYNVCLTVQNQHGCWDTICKPVELIPEFEFFIPNCFTPNGDDENEFFFGKGRGIKDYNIWLFDRWGNMIWDCHHSGKNTDWDSDSTIKRQEGMASACKWDGIVVSGGVDMNGNSGQLAQEDVYVWKVKLTDIFDKVHDYIGHVSIVK